MIKGRRWECHIWQIGVNKSSVFPWFGKVKLEERRFDDVSHIVFAIHGKHIKESYWFQIDSMCREVWASPTAEEHCAFVAANFSKSYHSVASFIVVCECSWMFMQCYMIWTVWHAMTTVVPCISGLSKFVLAVGIRTRNGNRKQKHPCIQCFSGRPNTERSEREGASQFLDWKADIGWQGIRKHQEPVVCYRLFMIVIVCLRFRSLWLVFFVWC